MGKKVQISVDGVDWFDTPVSDEHGKDFGHDIMSWLDNGPRSFYRADFEDGTHIDLVCVNELKEYLDENR